MNKKNRKRFELQISFKKKELSLVPYNIFEKKKGVRSAEKTV
ncbi:MAG: hypothetical protein ACJAYJ_002536 [Saprospiraceae bacterium]